MDPAQNRDGRDVPCRCDDLGWIETSLCDMRRGIHVLLKRTVDQLGPAQLVARLEVGEQPERVVADSQVKTEPPLNVATGTA